MISDEAVEAAARVFYHLQPNGTPLIREREQARAALEAALPHLLADTRYPVTEQKQEVSSSRGCGTGHSADAGSLPALAREAEKAPARDASGWLPVDSHYMPRDGSWFWAKSDIEVRFVHYADKYDRLPISKPGAMWTSVPTHWMPRDGGEAVHSPDEREGSRDEPKNTIAHPQKGGEG